MFCKKKKPSAGLVAWTHGGELANPGSNRTWAFTLTGVIRMKRDTNESCLYLFPSIFWKKDIQDMCTSIRWWIKGAYMHVLLQLKTKHMDSCK
jgi:hypothetical protein